MTATWRALQVTCVCRFRNTSPDQANQTQRGFYLLSEASNWPFLDPDKFQVC